MPLINPNEPVTALEHSSEPWAPLLLQVVLRWRDLGDCHATNGTRCVGLRRSFKPGELKWMHMLYPGLGQVASQANLLLKNDPRLAQRGVAEVQLPRAAEITSLQVPSDFRRFLACVNGAGLFAGHLTILGLAEEIMLEPEPWPPSIRDANGFNRPVRMPPQFLVFAFYPEDGGWVAFDSAARCVRCSNDGSPGAQVWGTFNDFLVAELDRLSTLFDDTGQLRV